MPTALVELSEEQLFDAIALLPPTKRSRLLKRLAQLPSAEESLEVADTVRPKFRASETQRVRLTDLLDKQREGELTTKERRELAALVDDFERRALGMAQAVIRSGTKKR